MKSFRADVEVVANLAKDEKLKRDFMALAEDARYSDPVSNPALTQLEEKLADSIAQARVMIEQDNTEEADKLCKSLKSLLMERNQKCKALK